MAAERMPVIALMGNPNVGKSTVFNALTGARQHTGNWSGKTVSCARGTMHCGGREMTLVDLPGTYSLHPRSEEERVARDFLTQREADAAVLVADATCLERNLILILQVLEVIPNVVVCLNLMDEARKKRIRINVIALERELGVQVVACAARRGRSLPARRSSGSAARCSTPRSPTRHAPEPSSPTGTQPISGIMTIQTTSP